VRRENGLERLRKGRPMGGRVCFLGRSANGVNQLRTGKSKGRIGHGVTCGEVLILESCPRRTSGKRYGERETGRGGGARSAVARGRNGNKEGIGRTPSRSNRGRKIFELSDKGLVASNAMRVRECRGPLVFWKERRRKKSARPVLPGTCWKVLSAVPWAWL